MSANINENKRVFAVGQTWHGLGKVVDNAVTAKEAIQLAQLDYPVIKRPLFVDNREVENHIAVVREDTKNVLGIVSKKYEIIPNVNAFSFFDTVVGEGQAIYHSAGALGLGEKIWILAKLPNDILINKDDIVEKYLCLANSHDGKSALRLYFTPVRVVCQNTLNLSLQDAKNGISIRHSGNVGTKVDEARRILGISINYYNQFETLAKQFENIPMTTETVGNYFDKVLKINEDEKETSTRKENQKDELFQLFENGKGQKLGNRHSLWKAYNAVTEYVDHFATIKNVDEVPTNKLKSIWFGNGAKVKENAYNEAVALV